MAILKHINVHNDNYHDFITYVLFQHDSHARPVYDENHVKHLRKTVLIGAINTTPWTFNLDCQQSNRQWKKNREPREIKSHHFILSVDPKDVECGLTLEKAHSLGMEFAQKHFSGHQYVVATHDDGNNHSGNIHLHICFNSLCVTELARIRQALDETKQKCNSVEDFKAILKQEHNIVVTGGQP